jgi:ribosome-binding protein aMBF1 (putative translation factor)
MQDNTGIIDNIEQNAIKPTNEILQYLKRILRI